MTAFLVGGITGTSAQGDLEENFHPVFSPFQYSSFLQIRSAVQCDRATAHNHESY